MALRIAHRARVVSRHRSNGLLVARRSIHQNFYHPKDVPAYQTPGLESGEYEGKEINEDDWDISKNRGNNMNYRSDEINLKAELEGQDHPSWIWGQDPEQFLPEEPSFWEFWGHYPFVFFGAAALLSKEYWLSYHSFPSHSSWIFLPIGTCFAVAFSDYRAQISHTRAQFRHDRDWSGMTMLRDSLGGLIGSYENDLKASERSSKYDTYVRALNQRKVAFYSHLRQKEFAQDLLRRLQVIKQTEQSYEENLKVDIAREGIEHVEKQIETDPKFKKQWTDNMFKTLAKLQAGKEPEFENNIGTMFHEFMDKKSKMLEKEIDNPRPVDAAARGMFEAVDKNLTSLRVYNGTGETPKDFVPRMTGAYGELTVAQKKLLPSPAALKKEKLRVIEEQLSRFQKDKQPKALLERKAAC